MLGNQRLDDRVQIGQIVAQAETHERGERLQVGCRAVLARVRAQEREQKVLVVQELIEQMHGLACVAVRRQVLVVDMTMVKMMVEEIRASQRAAHVCTAAAAATRVESVESKHRAALDRCVH